MLLNKMNIKNPFIKKHIPHNLQGDIYLANKWVWRKENYNELRAIVKAEEGRLAYFKDSPITSIEELFITFDITYKYLSDWDKNFIIDLIDVNTYSVKQKALILKSIGVINYNFWKKKLDREWLWSQVKEEEIKVFTPLVPSYIEEDITEAEILDTTEVIDDFEMLKYDFSDIMETKLYTHQVTTVNFLMSRDNGNGIVASAVGTGKTLVGITYSEQLYLEDKIKHTYILCPLVMVEIWKREILKHSLHKDLTKYTILNYEKIQGFNFKDTKNSLVLLDEGHRLKNNLSKRYKAFMKYSWGYVVPMSATIIGNKLKELKNIYGLMSKKAPVNNGEINLSKLKKVLIRVSKSTLELPDFVIKNVPISLDTKSEYKAFENEVLEDIVKGKELAIKEGKRPPNHLVKLLRLNQYSSNRNIVMKKQLPISEQAKFKVVFELIDDMKKGEQVIVWSNFVDTIGNLNRFLSDWYTCELIDGSVKQDKRYEILDSFRAGKIQVLIANPTTLSTGVTLVNSNKMIYFDRDFSSIKFIQALGRIHRIGQSSDCTMYNLFYKDTIEEYIIEILKTKEEMINTVLEKGSSTDQLITKDILDRLNK